MTDRFLGRRHFLQAAGVTLALPLLESTGAFAAQAASGAQPVKAAAQQPRRMLVVCFGLGLHAPNLFPTEAGRNFKSTPYLDALGKDLRDQMTIVSGTSHPEVTVGHASDKSFLTAARQPSAGSFRNTISLDQLIVEKLRPDTRFPYLTLGTRSGSLSFSRSGVRVPSDTRPSTLFAKLFVNGSAKQVAEQVRRLEDGHSVMDGVLGPARRLQAKVSAPDRERLDDYFSAVREVEQRLLNNQEWAHKPKPKVDYAAPKDVADANDDVLRFKLMLDLVYLAFQTDSTRYITLFADGSNGVEPIQGVTQEYHALSHHGKDPEKLAQLQLVETRHMQAAGELLGKLHQAKEGNETLLGRTAVLLGSAMGNASNHNCKNLPIILAGGGFKHGQHIAFDAENNAPLSRVYVSMLQRLGIESDQFGTGKGTLPGLEMV
jgi:hypothetical protein